MSAEDRRTLEELTVIDSLNEENCTVTYTTMGDQNTIRLNHVQPSLIRWERDGDVVKYALRGNDFSADGRSEIVFFSDKATHASAQRAIDNLYDRYCTGLKSEF